MPEERKKILFVITKSNFGGAQRYVYDLATTLPTDSFEPVVAFGGTGAVGDSAGTLERMLHDAGIRTVFIKHFARDVFLLKEFLALFELIALFRKEKPNVVHLNSSKAGGIGALAGRLAGVPRIIYTVHGWAYNEPVSLFAKSFRWLASLATTLLCHRVITVSHFDGIHTPLGLTTTTVHNGIPEPELLPQEKASADIRQRAGITDALPLIGTIAELHPNKGIDVLINAAALIKDAHVVVMGEGESRPALEALIRTHHLEERVHLLGFVEGARSFLRGFDIFVLPSRKEGLPYTILEAGAAGLPTVSTTVGGIPEIIDDGISGKLIDAYSHQSLADALTALLEHPNTRKRYGEELGKKVARYFNLRGMVKHTIDVYEQ